MKDAVSMGIIRLDYNYEAAAGDIDSLESYGYDVFYHVVPGMTFEKCQQGAGQYGNQDKDWPLIKSGIDQALEYFVKEKKVMGITGDCGFMMYYQKYIRDHPLTDIPIFMSALAQLPAVTCAYGDDEKIIIVTANKHTLEPMHALIADECGVTLKDERFIIIGAQDVPIFGRAVAEGKKVDVEGATPHIV